MALPSPFFLALCLAKCATFVPHCHFPRPVRPRYGRVAASFLSHFGTLWRNRCPKTTARKTVSRIWPIIRPAAVDSMPAWILVLEFINRKPVRPALPARKPVSWAPQTGAGGRSRAVSPRLGRALPLLIRASTTTVSHWTIDQDSRYRRRIRCSSPFLLLCSLCPMWRRFLVRSRISRQDCRVRRDL